MAVADTEIYLQDDLYKQMMTYFQSGDWRAGLLMLNQLIDKYPLEHDLRSMRQEYQLRAAIDSQEQADQKQIRRQKTGKGLVRGLGILGVVAIIVMIFIGSSNWLKAQAAQAQNIVTDERRTIELNGKYQQALQLIAAYRADEAETLLNEVQQVDPEYPGIQQALADAQKVKTLDETYQQAVTLKNAGDWKGAMTIFQTIASYRDSTLQIQQIQRQFSLSDLMAAGDQAVSEGNWTEAIAEYEQLRNQDPTYQREDVEERLYNSYINAAKTILEEQPDSLDALQEARQYFNLALSVRPQDPKVFEELAIARQTVADRLFNKYLDLAKQAVTDQSDSITALRKAEEYLTQAQSIYPSNPEVDLQRRMAQAYIQAMADFNKKKWDAAIKSLQFIYDSDIDYAGGTARQALYDAYIARGDGYMLNGRSQSALADYQAAVAIAQLRPDVLLRLFEAQARIGDALGIMGNYQTAVYQYRSALEEANIYETVTLTPELDRTLKNAESNAVRGRFKNAFNLYKDGVRQVVDSMQTVTHVVTNEDYLSRLAREYQTTVAAILAANKLTDPASLAVGDKIIVPVLPTGP